MNPLLAPEFARAAHRDLLDDGCHRRQRAAARLQRKAGRLTRRAAALARRATDLVERTHQ